VRKKRKTVTETIKLEQKRLGRKPLPEDVRRVQFGTRIAPVTLHSLEAIAEKEKKNLGRIIDDLVAQVPKDSA
jgi:hypothetical protein